MNAARAYRVAFLLAVTAASLSSGAEIIRIHVEDGRSGKTIRDEHVQVWINDKTGASLNLIPGPDGIAVLEAPAGSSIEVESNGYMDCRPFEKGAPRPTYSVDEIRTNGVIGQNTCGKQRSEARPGELLFFVRPAHWWEGLWR